MYVKVLIELTIMANPDDLDSDKDLGVVEAQPKPKLKRPSMSQVLLMNDDFTPMDFVIDVLSLYFSMTSEKATQVMLQVHTEGRGSCGVFTADVAETKVHQVNEFSKIHQHPLLCIAESMSE